MKALSLFSGIGGLDIAMQWAGIETVACCEIEPFPVAVLNKRFPDIKIFDDIKKLKGDSIDETIDVIHGGFPCQDLSQAGKQVGLTGARSGLWFEMLRVIHEVRPRYVLAENVRGAVNLALDTVYSGLVGEGYKVYPYVIPASAVGAPHQRERLFVVGVREDVADTYGERYLHRESTIKSTETRIDAQRDITTSNTFMENTGCELRQMLGNNPELRKASGQLNPDWVEQLMNYPEGWTDLDVDTPYPWQGWPALLGQGQYPYEPPRTCKGMKDRAKRLKALGNSVVPAQAYPFCLAISIIENTINSKENNTQ